MVYPEAIRERLAAYTAGAAGGGPVAELARETARAAGGDTVSFLVQLTERLHRECAWTLREEGDPLPPEETLEKRSGSCRDLAVLHAAACAEQGLAARFVTGYHESGRGCGDRYLHAWSEVYIPGGGWRGFDPSRGLAVGEEHVALAASASFRGAAPITGTFRGQGATATMRAEIDIRALRSGAQ
jgi:transglutaminase-like putative cysteine protease